MTSYIIKGENISVEELEPPAEGEDPVRPEVARFAEYIRERLEQWDVWLRNDRVTGDAYASVKNELEAAKKHLVVLFDRE